MRILYLSEARGVGGAEIYLERLVHGLRDDVTTLAAPRALAPWARRVSEGGGRVVLHDGWSSFPALVRLAREHDLVHLNLPSTYDGNAGFLGWALTALASRPLVVTEHLTRLPRSRRREWMKRRTAGAPAAVICVSEASADPLRARGLPRVVVVPNGVPDPGPPAPLPDGPLTVAVLATLEPRKNLALLVEATAACTAPVRLVFAGEGPERSALENAARRLGVDAAFLGRVEDPGPVLARAHLLALPSRLEAQPLSVLEAFAAGRGVLVSDLPGLDEVVTGDREGRRLPVDDVATWTAALEGARDAASRWGEAARATYRERFTLERFLADTRAVYARATGSD